MYACRSVYMVVVVGRGVWQERSLAGKENDTLISKLAANVNGTHEHRLSIACTCQVGACVYLRGTYRRVRGRRVGRVS